MNVNSILRGTILTGIFAVLFLPLYVPESMFFPFITGKNFAFRIIVEIIFAAWLILMYRDASYRPRKSWMLYALGALAAITALADIFGENPYRSFWSNYERMEGLIAHLHFLAYFVVVSSVLATERLWIRFFNTSLSASVLVSIYALFQLAGKAEIHQGGRIDASLGNATYLAVYMLFHIFIAVMLALRETTSKTMRWVYLSVAALETFILYHTATRGAILGFLGGALLTAFLLIFFKREDKRVKKFAAGAVALVVISVGAVMFFKDSEFINKSPVLSRFASISFDETTTKSRLMIWGMSMEGFKENPVLGWGQENYILLFNKYYRPEMYAQEPWFDRSHNVFFDWLISAGILGLLAYLSLFFVALYFIFRPGSAFSVFEKSILAGLLAAYFFQNIFVFDNMTSYLMFFSVLAYVAWRDREASPFSPPAKDAFKEMPPAVERFYAPVVIVITIAVLYFANVRPIVASVTLIKALQPQQEGIEKNLSYFEKAIGYGTFGNGEAREQLIQVAARVQGIAVVSDEIKRKFFEKSRSEMLLHIEKNPKDARYELFLGAFLNKFGRYEEALVHLNRAQELSPKKQSVFFEIASSYAGMGNYKKALEVMKEAYEEDETFADAQFIYGVVALYAREDALAEKLIKPLYGTMLVPDDRIINAYAARKEYWKVVELWKARVEGSPENADYRIALAAAYLETGERNKSVVELRKAEELRPDLKAQIEYYIKEIEAGRNP